MEQICNEVVRGLGWRGQDQSRRSAKVRDELEKEREMLDHLANEWREETVQMKPLEAKVQFEEKNAVVDRAVEERA